MLNIRKWTLAGFISLLIVSGGLSACMNRESINQPTQIPVITIEPIFKEEPSPVPTLTPTPAEPPETANYPIEGYGPGDFPEQINPLTGLKAVDPALLDRRPMIVKIQNAPRDSRPAWGLSLADHVIGVLPRIWIYPFCCGFLREKSGNDWTDTVCAPC